jgi:predicted nucleotidyltransferase
MYFKNYLFYAKEIKSRAKEILGDCRVMVFGSVLKDDYHPVLSDIDVLIISSKAPADSGQKAKIKVKLLSNFETGNPFEIHIISPDDYENWHSKFIKEKREI